MGMDSLNDMFFTSTASESLSYDQILEDVQKYCTEKHSDKLSTEGNQEEARKLLREFIFQYVISRSYRMEGMTTEELCDSLYEDMAGISFLKKWIYKPGIEEVNINAFDDIEVIMSGGRSMKIPDRFQSPQHAIDVTRRLLNTRGMVIDDTMPSVIGFLDKNIRISVDKTPIVDADVGINASIRIVNQQTVSKEKLIASGSATEEMLELLTCCIRYGVSVCIAGSTGSGKTTVMSWLLSMVPDNRRLITIEEGSREFDLIRRDEQGHALNSVVHLLTRPHENPSLDIDQDLLLMGILVFGLAIVMWFATYYKAPDLVKKRKKLIEAELPRFAVSIQQSLSADRDVLKLLTSYRRIAGPYLGQELDTTIADMKTGNYENALLHFQNRIGSTMLSDIVRGLIGTLRGDDQQMYFKMLVFDMRQIEQNNLKKEAAKRPKQMQKYSMMMLFCILLIYVVVLSVEVVGSLGAFF